MNAKDYERLLSRWTRTEAEMDQRVRGIREKGILSNLRGKHSPHLGPDQGAAMILCLVAKRAVEGSEIALKCGELSLIPPPNAPEAHRKMRTLIAFVSQMLEVPAYAQTLDRIEISESGEFARAVMNDSSILVFSNDLDLRNRLQSGDYNYDTTFKFGCEKRLYLSGSFLVQMAAELSEPGSVGYHK